MVSIRSQAAAFRRNSSEGESSGLDLTSEGDNQISPQDLLPQNFLFASTVRSSTQSVLEDEEMSGFNSHLTEATKISSLNGSSD
jgi:hypothetical protein